MKLTQTILSGVYRTESATKGDRRGTLTRLYCEQELGPALGNRRIVQINHTCTRTVGAVRGMHLQYPPHAEMKFVRCLKGSVWDVVVDLRAGSPTFLKWHAEELTSESGRMMIIPEGCAHGFQTLAPDSELLYLHTASYNSAAEGGFSCHDPRLNVHWPLPVIDLSARDANHAPIHPDFAGITI